MDKHLLVKRTLGCVCAATLMGAALATHHDSLNTVKAEEDCSGSERITFYR